MGYVNTGVGYGEYSKSRANVRGAAYPPLSTTGSLPGEHIDSVWKRVRPQPRTEVVAGPFGAEPRAPAAGVSGFKHEEITQFYHVFTPTSTHGA